MYNQTYNMQGIYSITSPSGKIYIGQSTDIEKRLYYYQTCWKHVGKQRKLYASFKKYGVENHIFDIVEECNLEILDKREIFYIDLFESTVKGLNIKLGGIGGKQTQETKDRIGESNRGIPRPKTSEQIEKLKGQSRTDETKLKMSIAGKNRNITWGDKISEVKKKNPYKYTEEDKEKMRANHGVPILQFTKDNQFVKEYHSAKQAERETGVKNDNICCCLKGKSKSAGGFIWRYK
jgi:group I intron endonuclease